MASHPKRNSSKIRGNAANAASSTCGSRGRDGGHAGNGRQPSHPGLVPYSHLHCAASDPPGLRNGLHPPPLAFFSRDGFLSALVKGLKAHSASQIFDQKMQKKVDIRRIDARHLMFQTTYLVALSRPSPSKVSTIDTTTLSQSKRLRNRIPVQVTEVSWLFHRIRS